MKIRKIFSFLVVGTTLAFIQGCKWEPVNPPCPIVTSISPRAARAGDVVTITGDNFLVNKRHLYQVKIADKVIDSTDVEIPDTKIMRFKVPIGIGSGPVTVTFPGKSDCSNQSLDFTYYYSGMTVELYSGTQAVLSNCTSPAQDCFNNPAGIDLDKDGNLLVADKLNQVVRKFTSSGKITYGQFKTQGCDSFIVNDSRAAKFRNPIDVKVNSGGDIYVAEEFNNIIRRLNLSGSAEVHAGKCQRSRIADGSCSVATIGAPYSISINGKDVYFSDNGSIRLSDGCTINTRKMNVSGSTFFRGIAFNSTRTGKDMIFIADSQDKTIKSLDLNNPGTDNVKVLTPLNSELSQPWALRLDSKGNIFFTDNVKHKIYVLYVNGDLVPLAGSGTYGYLNGPALNAQFRAPSGLALDEAKGILYISDTENNVIRKLTFQ